MVRTIVVPLDGSPFAEQALEPAQRIAQRLHAGVELVRVYEPQLPTPYVAGAPQIETRLDQDMRAEARDYLEAIARAERADVTVQVTVALLDGPVVETLANHLATTDGAMVVMMTHERSGLGRVLHRSVTEGLIRSASVAVLAIPARKDAPASTSTGEFGHVLIPLEGPHFGTETVDRAVEIAGTTGVDFLLLHVISPLPVIPAPEPPIAVPLVDLDAEQVAAHTFLEQMANPLRARGIHVSTKVVIHGDPVYAIVDCVKEDGIDLIGMATHGYRGVKHLVLGSVAEKVLHSSLVPVFLVRPPDENEEKSRAAGDQANVAR